MRRALILFALLTAGASAQVRISPPNPTPGDDVSLFFDDPGACEGVLEVTRTGNHFVIRFGGCPFESLTEQEAPLGQLEPGIYTYEIHVFFITDPPVATGSFAVLPAPIPALSPHALAALCAALAMMGLVMARRA